MNEAIGTMLKEIVMTIEMADKVAGLTRPVSMKIGDTLKTFPVGWDVSHRDCIKGRYNELMPNSKNRSVVYFEDQGTTFIERMAKIQYFESRIRLVAWLDTSKFPSIECPHPLSTEMILQIVAALPVNRVNWGRFREVQIEIQSEVVKSNAIFGAYTYDEQVTQYLFYPYDYFALNFSVLYGHHIDC